MSKLDDLRIDAPVPKPSRSRKLPWLPFVVVLFIAAVVLYFQRDKLAQVAIMPSTSSSTSQSDETITVKLSRGPAAGSISAAGYIEAIPPGPTVVSSMVSGRVSEILATPGQAVEAGELLATLDSGLFDQQAKVLASQLQLSSRRLDLLRAGFRVEEIEQAQSDVRRTKAKLELAEINYESSLTLFNKGVVPRLELDTVQSEMQQSLAQVEASQAQLGLLQAGTRIEEVRIAEAGLAASYAELANVRWEIAQCSISAPVSGVVMELFAHPGTWVTPGRDDPLSAALLSILDPQQVQAWVDVNQRDSAALFVGQQTELATDADPLRVVSGTVSRIMPQANLQKNTVQAKITIDHPPADFRPELSVKVVFLPPETGAGAEQASTQGIWLPASAITEKDGVKGVFVLRSGKAKWQPVATGDSSGGKLLIESGLNPGDQVLASPGGYQDGQTVKGDV